MSITTATFAHGAAAASGSAGASAPRKTFFERFIEARLRTGREHAASVLARMSDDQLAGLGFKPDQIREVRAGKIPARFWA